LSTDVYVDKLVDPEFLSDDFARRIFVNCMICVEIVVALLHADGVHFAVTNSEPSSRLEHRRCRSPGGVSVSRVG
jgi:hypothetical protein